MSGELQLFTYQAQDGSSEGTDAFTINESGLVGGLLQWRQDRDPQLNEAAMTWPSGGKEHPTDDYLMVFSLKG